MLIAVRVPANNPRGPLYIEQFLDALHARGGFSRRIQLEIARYGREVSLFCRFPPSLQETVFRELHAAYPDCAATHLDEAALHHGRTQRRSRTFLALSPRTGLLRTWEDFHDSDERVLADPVAALFSHVADETRNVRAIITVRPKRIRFFGQRFGPSSARRSKHNQNLFSTRIQICVTAPKVHSARARRKLRDVVATFARFTVGHVHFHTTCLPRSFLLTTRELASLWHPPTQQVRTERLATVSSRELEPPPELTTRETEEGTTVLGRIAFRDRTDLCGIRPNDRLRHLYVIGKTGMGKTTLLESQARADIEAGHGVLYIDPHGDSAERLAAAIPPRRTNDVIYFDPADRTHAIGLNILSCPNADDRPRLASEIVTVLQHIYGIDPTNAPRLLDITRNAVLALLEVRGSTLLSLVRMLGDRTFRSAIVSQVRDPVVRQYWQDEFGGWKPSEQAIAVASVLNKIRPFVVDYRLRNILGQERNRLDLRRAMDDGKVLIANLSKGRLGEDASNLIGSLLVTKLQLAAMSRANAPEPQRRPFYAFVDEFQSFATESFATILSEARKYGLALTIANQYLGQLSGRGTVGDVIRGAVFGNVGSLVAFQVGADDAPVLAEQLGGGILPEDLINLPKYRAYVRLLVEGMPSRPFSIETLPTDLSGPSRLAIIRSTSRRRYGSPVEVIS